MIDLQTRGNVSQAAEELERAIKAGMDNAAAYFDLGLLRYLGGNYEDAILLSEKMVKDDKIRCTDGEGHISGYGT